MYSAMKLDADTISIMPSVASSISTGNSNRALRSIAIEFLRHQDAERRADQDQKFGEARETVNDEGAVESARLVRYA